MRYGVDLKCERTYKQMDRDADDRNTPQAFWAGVKMVILAPEFRSTHVGIIAVKKKKKKSLGQTGDPWGFTWTGAL